MSSIFTDLLATDTTPLESVVESDTLGGLDAMGRGYVVLEPTDAED